MRDEVRTFTMHPADFGFACRPLSELQVASARESADVIRAVLAGAEGPPRDVVVLNAGAALYVGEAAASLEAGMTLARTTLDSGAARETLERYLPLSRMEDV